MSTQYVITPAEQAEGQQQIEALRLELVIAKDRLEEQQVLMARDENWRNYSEQRRKAQLAHDVTSTEQRIARLERFLATAVVADPAALPAAA